MGLLFKVFVFNGFLFFFQVVDLGLNEHRDEMWLGASMDVGNAFSVRFCLQIVKDIFISNLRNLLYEQT